MGFDESSVYNQIIDDLSKNDSEFLNLSSQEQDSLIDSLAQEVHGKTPNVEKFLQLAMKNSGLMAPSATLFNQTASLPLLEKAQVAFQTGQGMLGNLPQNIMERPMSFMRGGIPGVQAEAGARTGVELNNAMKDIGKLSGIPGDYRESVKSDLYKPQIDLSSVLMPSSEKGRNIATLGNLASGTIPIGAPKSIMKAGDVAGQAADLINPIGLSEVFKKKVQIPLTEKLATQTLVGIQEEDFASKAPRINKFLEMIQRKTSQPKLTAPKEKIPSLEGKKLDDILFGAEEEIPAKIDALQKRYTAEFEKGFSQVKSSMSRQRLADAFEQTMNQLDPQGFSRDVPGTAANKALKLKKRVMPKESNPSEIVDAKFIQDIHKKAMLTFGTDMNARIKYNRNLHNVLDTNAGELSKLKSDYAPKFEIIDEANKYLTQSGLSKVARGTASELRLGKMRSAASKIESGSVQSAEDLFKSHTQKINEAKAKYQAELDEFNKKSFEFESEKSKQWGKRSSQRLSDYESSLKERYAKEMEDLKTEFDIDRENLNLEQLRRYKALATAAGTITLISGQSHGIREWIKERF